MLDFDKILRSVVGRSLVQKNPPWLLTRFYVERGQIFWDFSGSCPILIDWGGFWPFRSIPSIRRRPLRSIPGCRPPPSRFVCSFGPSAGPFGIDFSPPATDCTKIASSSRFFGSAPALTTAPGSASLQPAFAWDSTFGQDPSGEVLGIFRVFFDFGGFGIFFWAQRCRAPKFPLREIGLQPGLFDLWGGDFVAAHVARAIFDLILSKILP